MNRFHVMGLVLLVGSSSCGTKTGTTCEPASCAGCCQVDGTCAGGNAPSACGLGGAQCQPCGANFTCTLGQCTALPSLGGGQGGGGGGGSGNTGGGNTGGGNTGGGGANPDAGVVTCAAPLTACGGACVDATRDLRNCGVCGVSCNSVQLCINGACVGAPTCDAMRPCPSGSYCTQAGTCRPGCDTADQCPQPGACDVTTHTCVCASGRRACGQRCVEADDLTACGASCASCEAPANGTASCNGSCSFTCGAGTHRCGDLCASNSAVESCGTSCTPCTPPANATATCDGTTCDFTCNPGYHRCGNACVSDTATATCGTSCSACASDPNGMATCDGTSCGLSCNTSYRACNGSCRSCPSTGAMGTACSGSTCVATACANGYRLCDGGCGQCPTTGVTSTTCLAAACVPSACEANYRLCNNTCVSCPTQNVTATGCNNTTCEATACGPGFKVCSTGCCPKWTVLPIADAVYGNSTGLAFTANGDAILAYPSAGSKVSLKRWSGGTTFTTQTTPFTSVNSFALALTAAEQPAFALITGTSGNQLLSYAEFNGSTWTTTQVFNAAAVNASIIETMLLFSPSGEPVIVAFVPTTNTNVLRVWRRNSGMWSSEDVAAAALGSTRVHATFVGAELQLVWSTPASMYRDSHARVVNAAWSSTQLNTSNAYGNGLAVNGNSIDLFTVTTVGGSGIWVRLWNTVWNGTSYGSATVVEELTPSTASSGGGAWLDVASRGAVTHLAYGRQAPYSDLRHAWRTGTTGTFNTETIEAISPTDISIAVGPAGDTAVVYRSFSTPMGVRFAFER